MPGKTSAFCYWGVPFDPSSLMNIDRNRAYFWGKRWMKGSPRENMGQDP